MSAGALVIVGLLAPGVADAAPNIKTGLLDQVLLEPDAEEWFDRADEAGAGIARINVPWRTITGNAKPADPTDPSDPAYAFTSTDRAIRGASAQGFDVLLTVYLAPDWAEAKQRPADIPAGTWKPDPEAFADFGTAVATRYSGKFTDPLDAAEKLPRARYYHAWNEANHGVYLNPQWSGKKPKGPELYRGLLNAFYDAVKDVKSSNKVVGPGQSPFGDPKGGDRMRPVLFLRELFCLSGRKNPKPKSNCSTNELPKLDIVSHHPINIQGGPRRAAKHPDDATSADLDRIRKVMRAAEKAGNVLPRKARKKSKRRQLWVTEFFWFSNPPDDRTFAVSLSKQAQRISESLYLMWQDGARVAVYLGLRDAPAFGSGLFFEDGTEKPAFTAFRFPFVTDRKSAKKIKVWGKAPISGRLKVQEKRGSGWKTIDRFKVKEGKVFYEKVSLKGGAKLRGQVKGETSRSWKQKG